MTVMAAQGVKATKKINTASTITKPKQVNSTTPVVKK